MNSTGSYSENLSTRTAIIVRKRSNMQVEQVDQHASSAHSKQHFRLVSNNPLTTTSPRKHWLDGSCGHKIT